MNPTEFQFYTYVATVFLMGAATVAYRPTTPIQWAMTTAMLIVAGANLILLVLGIFGLPL